MNYSLSVFPCSNVPRSIFLPDYRKSKFFNQLREISTEVSWVTVVVPFGNQNFLECFSDFGNTYNRASLHFKTDLKLRMWSEKLKYRNLVKIK